MCLPTQPLFFTKGVFIVYLLHSTEYGVHQHCKFQFEVDPVVFEATAILKGGDKSNYKK